MGAFFDFAGALGENFFLYVLVLLFSLAVVILIHELGHYLAARFFGVRVEKYSIGFGRELWGFDDAHGTRWSLSRLPFGGYVKLFGDVDASNPVVWDHEKACERRLSADEMKVSFCAKPVWQRMLIVFAGPLTSFMFAVALFFCLYFFYGQSSRYPVITALGLGAASFEDGFALGDRILAMDGREIRRFKDIYDLTKENPAQVFHYRVLRGEEIIDIKSAPGKAEYTDTKGVEMSHGRTGMLRVRSMAFEDILSVDGVPVKDDADKAREILRAKTDRDVIIGISLRADKEDFFLMRFPGRYNAHLSNSEDEDYDRIFLIDRDEKFHLKLGFTEALASAFESIGKITYRSYRLLRYHARGRTDEPLIGGVATVSTYAAESAENGFHDYMVFLAVFSLLIALINILPVPMLDGGFLVFLTYELISGKQISPRIQNYAFAIGLVFIGGIVIMASLYDLINFLKSLG